VLAKGSVEGHGRPFPIAVDNKWSMTLVTSSTGRPADWLVAEAKHIPELKGGRQEAIERTIRDTIEAHLTTIIHSAEAVQRGFELYKAMNDPNGVSSLKDLANDENFYIVVAWSKFDMATKDSDSRFDKLLQNATIVTN